MAARWIEAVTGPWSQKRRYWRYKARRRALPAHHRTAVEGLDRYVMVAGGIADGGVLVQMLEDLVDLFEQSAADGLSVADVVGEDPVEFAETFLASYDDARWVTQERRRLGETIARATSIEQHGARG